MNLHRNLGKPDWENIPAPDRNSWQQAAYKTNGLITPSNLVTLLGLAITLYGVFELLDRNFISAAAALTIGRLCDIADGWLAEVTGTKSPLGEIFDAVTDKVVTFLALIAIFYIHAAPRWVIILLAVPQIAASIVVLHGRVRQVQLHPSSIAKLGMATAWVAIIGYVLTGQLHEPFALTVLLGILTIVSVVLSSIATYGYVRRWS